jgi:cytochrome bd ubiquinol oxidase subunit II
MIVSVGFLIPIMLFYNIYRYVVFHGKVAGSAYGEQAFLAPDDEVINTR